MDQPWNRDQAKRDELEATGRFHVVESDQVKALVATLEEPTAAG